MNINIISERVCVYTLVLYARCFHKKLHQLSYMFLYCKLVVELFAIFRNYMYITVYKDFTVFFTVYDFPRMYTRNVIHVDTYARRSFTINI